MASGSNYLTTYYAKRIVGDTAAADAAKALLQTGANITTHSWILIRSNRLTNKYGIRYKYDSSNTNDKIEFYGGYQVSNTDTPTAWVQLDTGDAYFLGKVGIGYDPNTSGNTYKLYVNGTSYFTNTAYFGNGTTYYISADGSQYSGNAATATTASYLDAPNQYGYYTDEYGNFIYKYAPDPDDTTAMVGYFHLDNNDKTISLRYYWDSGDLRVPGKVGIGYNPTTSGNTHKLYVNGTSYFTNTAYFGNGTTYYISANGSQYSGNAATATTATAANLLNINNRAPIKGNNQLEFQQFSGTGSTGWNNSNPTNDWYHHIRMNHGNSSGYFVDLAFCFHAENNFVRRVAGGSDNGWKRLWTQGNSVTNAVWNDLAESRKSESREPGYVITPSGAKTTKRLEPGCRITSDTWGFALGDENDETKMPVAISGRVLAYPARPREEYHLGDCVCSAPDGKVDIMTRQEIRDWPDCIVGIVNEIPDYEEWGSDKKDNTGRGKIKVNGRIWIDIK